MIYLLFIQFFLKTYFVACQWNIRYRYLFQNQIFQERIYSESNFCFYPFIQYTGSFMIPSQFNRTANFISCNIPNTSYITLNYDYPEVQIYQVYCYYYNCDCRNNQYQSFIQGILSFDLYFQGTWNNGKVIFSIGSFTYDYEYNSPPQYTINKQFCDDINYDIKTVNFSIPYSISGNFKFTIQNSNNEGQVSIRKIYHMVYNLQCYPSCKSCTRNEKNQCTSCYYGVPTNGICPPCPSNQYYVKYYGCRPICDSIQPLCYDGFCNPCSYNYTLGIAMVKEKLLSNSGYYREYLQWSKIYDPSFIDDSVDVFIHQNQYLYGIFKRSSGIVRQIPISYKYGYYLKVRIVIVVFDGIPLDCGIQFQFNNSYVGSIFKNNSGVQLHKFKEFSQTSLGPYYSYSNSLQYQIDGFFDLPKNTTLFTAIGNFSNSLSGWALKSIEFLTNNCTNYCIECDVNYKCKECSIGYRYRDGTCIQYCDKIHQVIIQGYCKDLDDETPYSQLLIKEDLNEFNQEYYPEYTLLQSNGSDFLKGSDRYFSYWEGYRILGGQFIWAQARFRRIFQNLEPHHSISVGFYVLFGPSFPSDGLFIYKIEQEEFFTTTQNAANFQNRTKQQIIRKKANHSLNILTLELQCYGPNNDVALEYCGFYNFYLAIHYCQPFCLSCTDEKTCNTWNSTYDSSLIQFSQDECESNQYFNEYQLLCVDCQPSCSKCVDCQPSCSKCVSKLNCLICLNPSYTLTTLGCFCNKNQFEESSQCINCPKECNQCLSSTYCTECLPKSNRNLSNGQCLCRNGYYQKDNEVVCLLCDQFCGNCFGPTSNDCLTCNSEVLNILLINTTCKCSSNSFYDASNNKCTFCHQNCLTCLNDKIDGCLTCDSSQNKQLKGLRCECKSGYQSENNICIQCPSQVDISLLQCYKYCNNGELVWHTSSCDNCGSGFELISNECIPICGDLQVVGYEQCDDGNTFLNDKCYNCQFQCPISCLSCDISTILPCDICGDGLISGDEECEDGNDVQYDGCYNCKYQCQNECTQCFKGKCLECATRGWELEVSALPWRCKEICGDGYVVGIEECDDSNFRESDSCHNCKFLCRIGCSFCDYKARKCLSCEFPGFKPQDYYCIPIPDDGLLVSDPYGFYYEFCENNSYFSESGGYKCQPIECANCQNQKCQACKEGQKLSNDNICQPICGDQIKASNEYCEDYFTLPYRGCQNCQPKCQVSCKKCSTFGIGCSECNQGFKLIDNLCYSQCGNMLIMYEKECDDGNLIHDDGCHFCQLICQNSCQYCIKGVCQICFDGYQLISGRCYEIISPFNKIIYSNNVDYFMQMEKKLKRNINYGWHDFQNQLNYLDDICRICFANCQNCNQEFCLSCFEGYYLNEQQECKSQCGDGILTQDEQCEINQPFCFNCVFIEPYCQETFNNICIKCKYGYHYDKIKSLCISQCGDGIIAHDEECESFEIMCEQCKYKCGEYCLNFKDRKCLVCEESFQLQNGFCYKYEIVQQQNLICKRYIQNICVECQDQYFLDFYGECQPSCQDSCVKCKFGICYECIETYYLFQHLCYQKTQCSLNLYSNFGLDSYVLYCGEQLSDNQLTDKYNYFKSLSDSQYIKSLYENYFNVIQQLQIFEEDIYLEKFEKLYPSEIVNDLKMQFEQDYYNDQDLIIYLLDLTCNVNCIICVNNQCLECEIGWNVVDFYCVPTCGDSLIVGNEQCEDNNLIAHDGCYQCQYQCVKNCEICEKGKCLKCILDFQLGLTNQCNQIHFQNVPIPKHQYDCKIFVDNHCIFFQHGHLESITGICIINYIPENECFGNCQTCINQKCQQCNEGSYGQYCLKGDGINFPIERCADYNQQNTQICNQYQQCDQNCLYCVNQICYICNEGTFLFNNQCIMSKINTFKYKSEIEPKCGDGFVQIFEECDDRNPNQVSKCYNCKLSCFPECNQCSQGICQACIEGYVLNQEKQCQIFCGDKIIVPYSEEQCDDGNFQDLDGCYQCKIECQNFCLYCNDVYCFKCEEGFFSNQFSCNPICGDGIVIQNFEECDDSNNIPYDGCFECQFQCRKNCVSCIKGVCLDQCPEGMQYQGDICVDKPCIKNCQICELGFCFQCNPEYSYDDQLNLCIKINNIEEITPNIMENDENFWLCHLQECVYSPAPNMLINYLNQTFAKQYIEIVFDQEIKCISSEEDEQEQETFQFMFTNLKVEQYEINLFPIQPISQNLDFVKYIVQIENLVSLDEKPNFQIILQSVIVNQNNQKIQNKQVTLKLNKPNVMSNLQQQSSQFMQNTNKVFMFGAISASIISIFSGDSSFFLETLDVLQQQSYLKFINANFPQNLQIYFEASNMLSVSSYFQNLNFDYYYKLIAGEIESNELDGKFKLYDVDPDVIISLVPQVFQCLSLVLLFFWCKPIYRLFFRIMEKQIVYDYLQGFQQRVRVVLIKLLLLIQLCFKKTIEFKSNLNLKNFLMLNAWDLLFKSFLQLRFIPIQLTNGLFQIMISVMILCVYCYHNLNFFKRKNINQNLIDSNANKYFSLDLVKKFIYNFILIFFSEDPALQILFLSIINLTQCIIIFMYEQSNTISKLISILNEGSLSLFSLTSLIYIDKNNTYFSKDTIIKFGFIQMGILLLNLVIVFLKQMLIKIHIILGKICKKKQKNEIRNQILMF